jgi:dolichyl-phosphate-mannose-protein mannosyltransferase
LIVGAITMVAGGLRLYRLAQPDEKVFDEVYYASDACWYAGHPYQECGLKEDTERSWVHPPLGKILIAMGIDGFGNRPFGWRFTAAVAGTATVGLVGALAFLLFASVGWAAVAALLAGTEHLLFVQSRVAMLDVFLAFFVVLAFLLLVADRLHPIRFRPFRLAAGAALGAAVAVKWSGVLALLAAIVLAVVWERTRRKEAGEEHPLRRTFREEGLALYLALTIVPLLAYAVTWIPWLAERSFDVAEWTRHHGDMAGYHLGLDTTGEDGEPIHPYMSRAWSWFLLTRPVSYFWRGEPSCCAEILGIGNPLLFWGALLVVPYLALAWRTRRDWRAGALLVPILAQFLPWLAVSRPLFLFYMVPVTPFLAIGTAFAIRDLLGVRLDHRVALAGAAAVVAVSVGLFAFFWPVLTATTISIDAWQARMWFRGWI